MRRLHSSETIKESVAFALWPVDVVSGDEGTARLEIKLEKETRKAIRNLSGFYVFTGLDPGTHVVKSKAVGLDTDRYLPVTLSVDTTSLDAQRPFLELLLPPSAAYPFAPYLGAGALVTGTVTFQGKPVEVSITVFGEPRVAGASDDNGRFAMFLPMQDESDIVLLRFERDGIPHLHSTKVTRGKVQDLDEIVLPA